MKALKVLVFTQGQGIENVLTEFENIQSNAVQSVEEVVESMPNFDLLIIDKNLDSDDFKKINKLANILFSEYAVVNINLNDTEFLKFKLNTLLQDWATAQEPTQRVFTDTYNMNCSLRS